MTIDENKNLTELSKNEKFNKTIKKLTIGSELTNKEKTYILTIALIFLKYYDDDDDKKFTTYIEFAYYIILKYSISYQDYKSLYDFSTEFGFFPIAKNILDNGLIDNLSIKDILIDSELDSYSYKKEYIQTLEQFATHNNLLEEELNNISFVAPTSYGKSSIIVDFIKKYNSDNIKIAVIVPSKSLLIQTFDLLKKQNLKKRLLLHDEMYANDKSFIAIFTQERALRLLKKENIYFDILFIDEAHNLFKKDSRSILLSRLIKRNLNRFKEAKVIYLSPLIADSNNLKILDSQIIHEQRIHFNIKETEIFEYLTNKSIRKYNRFMDRFYDLGTSESFIQYIKDYTLSKNFIYLRNPKKIEEFSKELSQHIPIQDESLEELINILKLYVHEEFYITKFIDKGIIYLHGNLPDSIKEYLEYKFNTISSLKYMVANTVVLEGINLPIDNMFILNVYELSEKELTNLIGRVNRLNEVFTKTSNNLYKLLPNIHFLNNDKYNRKNGKMENAIKKLKSRIFEDKIKNPTLNSFDFNELERDIEKAKKSKMKDLEKKEKMIQQKINNKENILKLVSYENVLAKEAITDTEKLKKYLIENDISSFYANIDNIIESLYENINSYKKNHKWENFRVIDKVYDLFIRNYDNEISNQKFEFERLKEAKSRNYYNTFIKLSHSMNLKERINNTLSHFKTIKETNNSTLYMGHSYGEVCKRTKRYNKKGFNVYVDLSTKKDIDLVNLAIVKIQMEEKFINYSLNRFVEMLYDYNMITDEEYNLHIYGTKEVKNIKFIKFGLTSGLIAKLDEDNQLDNIELDNYGKLIANKEFEIFLLNIDDFYRFQINKFISSKR